MGKGPVLILNGTSSSGKTSIVRAFQELAPEPYLDAGIDKFLWMLAPRYIYTSQWREVFYYDYAGDGKTIQAIRTGPLGFQLMAGMHAAIAALAGQGNPVIADHVMLEEAWFAECARLFCGLRAYLIAVRCPLEVLEEREKNRKDRTLGQARAQYGVIHALGIYDFEVDTSVLSPAECAAAILDFTRSGVEPAAFIELADRFNRGSRR